jgi:EAL domain-containing protein (putative c-di-GMP-specific phosphodiesterase class I)
MNFSEKSLYGYHALPKNEGIEDEDFALPLLSNYSDFEFDQDTLLQAIRMASMLKLQGMLCLDLIPRTAFQAEVLANKIADFANKFNFAAERIMVLISERQQFVDQEHLNDIFKAFKNKGFITVMNNFGAGFSGLNRLADCQPEVIRLDSSLTRNIENDRVKKSILSALIQVCKALSISMIAEGIESKEQLDFLYSEGVNLFQGVTLQNLLYESSNKI